MKLYEKTILLLIVSLLISSGWGQYFVVVDEVKFSDNDI